jgi:hypothetical protein
MQVVLLDSRRMSIKSDSPFQGEAELVLVRALTKPLPSLDTTTFKAEIGSSAVVFAELFPRGVVVGFPRTEPKYTDGKVWVWVRVCARTCGRGWVGGGGGGGGGGWGVGGTGL